ncbi:IS30 family transposase, partial [bacterium]|nr:IS30 family transposase [bacterium]
MTTYTQLTQVERYQIQALFALNNTPSEIAAELGRHKSTVSRELRRNRQSGEYCAEAAQQQALSRHREKARPLVTPLVRALIKHKLKQDWSPKLVSLWLAANKPQRASHTWI